MENTTETQEGGGGTVAVVETTTSVVNVSEVAQLNETITGLNETVSALNEQLEVLNNKCVEVYAYAHQRLASEVAILSKVLNKVTTRNKSLEEATGVLLKRATQSLEDTLSDLLLEFDGTAKVAVEEIVKVDNPTIVVDETKDEKPLGEISKVEEAEEEQIFIHRGLSDDQLEAKIKEFYVSRN